MARRLLRGLASDYADGLAEWHAWLAQGDWQTLRHAAHTLQGLAGTLAAAALRSPAQALELAAAAQDTGQAGHHLRQTEAQLAHLLNALEALRWQIADAPPPDPTPAGATPAANTAVPMVAAAATPPAAPAAAMPDLADLAALLADGDSRAIDWWQAHEPALSGQLDPVALRGLSRAIGRFDFDAALALCPRLHAAAETAQP